MQTWGRMGLKDIQGPALDIRSWHFNGVLLPHLVMHWLRSHKRKIVV